MRHIQLSNFVSVYFASGWIAGYYFDNSGKCNVYVGRGSSFPYPPPPSSSHSRYTRTYITSSDLVVHIYIHFISCVLQEEKFKPLSQFASVSDFKYTLADNFGTVNFIADRSKAISSAIERVYGDKA